MKTVNYSFPSNFVDFALSAVTLHEKKLDVMPRARTSWGESSDLHAGLELDHLSGIAIENRGISRAIGMQFVFTDLI